MQPHACPKCEYDLHGSPGPVCPECGLPFAEMTLVRRSVPTLRQAGSMITRVCLYPAAMLWLLRVLRATNVGTFRHKRVPLVISTVCIAIAIGLAVRQFMDDFDERPIDASIQRLGRSLGAALLWLIPCLVLALPFAYDEYMNPLLAIVAIGGLIGTALRWYAAVVVDRPDKAIEPERRSRLIIRRSIMLVCIAGTYIHAIV
ncbi:MAG: hypothetical protein AAF747_09695 [Planctomycetota bacterium]